MADAQVVISEIMYDASGSDANQEWIELFNTGSTTVDLKLWKINDGSNHVLNIPPKNGGVGSMLIAPGGYLVRAGNAAEFRTTYPQVGSVIDTTLSLSNAGAILVLTDASSTVKDKVSYDSSRGAAGDGNSLNRISAGAPFAARIPSPSAPASEGVIPPPAPKAVPQKVPKTSNKNTAPTPSRGAAASVPRPVTTEVAPENPISVEQNDAGKADENSEYPVAETQIASAAFAFSWWWIGALLLALVGGVAMMLSRTAMRREWDIVEEKE